MKKPRGKLSLKIQDEDSDQKSEEQANKKPNFFMAPPSRSQHQLRFGDHILGDLNSDDETGSAAQKEKDKEVPKPTVDVLMSRNLRSGAGKNFNFGALDSSSDEDNSNDNEEN